MGRKPQIGGSTWIVQDHMLAAGIEQDAQAYWEMRSEKRTPIHSLADSVSRVVCKRAAYIVMTLLMEEILHHLGCIKPCKS